ncbi:phospholipase D family protein [Tenacibaculum ovolyticum]|uniref:phospholipase D family protein n=1 Tax=Tenacibaculum ovolyticum TaxID=104270 RepID=UPI0007ED7B49|nr:phospholipase D family protein [Tenacibaculum ovolyticum]
MDIRFIGQGYNLEANTSVASEIITALRNTDYTSFQCLVAFASFNGVSALTEHIEASKEYITEHKIIVGIDHEGTSREALEELLAWDVEAFIYYFDSNRSNKPIFHPKIYLFKGAETSQVILGSNNFTEYGLTSNVEGAISITYLNDERDDNQLINQIESYYENLLNLSDENLKRITIEQIQELHDTGDLPSDERSRERQENARRNPRQEENDDSPRLGDLFAVKEVQERPADFRPRRRRRTRVVSEPANNNGNPFIGDVENWVANINNPVLIAEIGGGVRWKQVNFPIQMFQDFFGATAGDNRYHINLRHVNEDGELQEVEDRQAVTVASRNYRFEIGVARGVYPVGNRPIGVFVRVAPQNFLYYLVMPTTDIYTQLNNYLIENYNGPNRNLNRIQTTLNTLLDNCEGLPF